MKRAMTVVVFSVAAVVLAAFFFSCAGLQSGGGDAQTLSALADAVGFAAGAYCHDHPAAKATVESIYNIALTGQISPMAALNEGTKYFLDEDDIAARTLAHEVFTLIRLAGGSILDKQIIDWGEADIKLFEIAKSAYLEGLGGSQT